MIITDRLVLRQWQDTDRAGFAALNASPEVMRHFPATLDRAQSNDAIDRYRAAIEDQGFGFWAAERQADGCFIGFIGINVPPDSFPFSPCVEIGWRLAEPYWGLGYASEGARAALDFGFTQAGLEEIVSMTTLTNLPSMRVMQRIGMHDSGRNFRHPALAHDHPMAEHVLYRLNREQWQSQRHAQRESSAD